MKKALLAAIVVMCSCASPAVAGRLHFSPPLAKRPLPARAAGQRLVIHHDLARISATCWARRLARSMRLFGTERGWPLALDPRPAMRECRYSRAELRWTRRELAETLRAIAAKRRQSKVYRSTSRPSGFTGTAEATWYGPGFYAHGNACGTGRLSESSWWVATVPKQCGVMYTICDGGRCVRVPAEDTGGFAPGNFDLTPAVARALGGLYTHHGVRYRRG